MSLAATIRNEIELALSRNIPSALSPRAQSNRELMPSGVEEIDRILDGGLPVGAITELVGVEGSGRTTITLAYAAATARDGKVAAWVDAGDAFNPSSAALNGVDLERLLWVRCKQKDTATSQGILGQTKEALLQGQMATVRVDGSPRPRSEANGMPQAISALLQAHGGLHDKQARREQKIGTPGAPNRSLEKSLDREEQTPTDRLPSHRDEQAISPVVADPRCAESQPHRRKNAEEKQRLSVITTFKQYPLRSESPWTALGHALRATDLLLQAGGFSLIVLDLGGTPPEMSWRVPLATWFRYRAACERSRTSLLLITQHPCARSSAELVVRLEAGDLLAEGNVLTGFTYRAEIERQRFKYAESNVVSIRRPPQSGKLETWKGRTPWAV